MGEAASAEWPEGCTVYPGGFTVRDALELEHMREVGVVGGHLGLDRPVRWVHILDIPDIVPWVSRGDLVLTNAYAFSHDPQSTEHLVGRLDDKGVSGLIVGTGLFIERVPPHMIEEADRRDFPLLEIPWRVRFEDVTLQLTQAILGFQYQVLDRVRMASQELLQASHREDFERMAEVLSRALDRSVVILDGRVHAVAGSDRSLLEEVRRLGGDIIEERLIEWSKSQDAPEFHSRLEFSLGERRVRAQPISTGDRLLGAILLEAPRPVSGPDSLILSVASTAIALEFMRLDEPSKTLFERRQQFLDELIKGVTEAYPSIEGRAAFLGWTWGQPFTVAVLDVDRDGSQLEEADQRAAEGLRRRMVEVARLYLTSLDCMVTQQGGWSLTIALPERSTADVTRTLKPLRDAIARLFGDAGVTTGLAGPDDNLLKLQRLCGEAWEAVRIARKIGRSGQQVTFDDVRAEHLLLHFEDTRHTALTLVPELQRVLDYDGKHDRDLFETLEAFLDCWGNVGEMARELYVHRNTARYRIQKLEELLGHSLEDPEYRFALQLATRLIRLGDS